MASHPSQRRHQAKTVAQLKDFVGKLGGLQTEHQSLGLRKSFPSEHPDTFIRRNVLDTRLSEMLVPLTRTAEFNRSLEIQQSIWTSPLVPREVLTAGYPPLDLLASYGVANQIASIEEMIAQGAEMQIVVRLLCLASITSGGIKGKILERIKRDFLQVRMRPSILPFDPNAHRLDIRLQPSTPSSITLSPSPLHTPA